jgi:hypothetical protein
MFHQITSYQVIISVWLSFFVMLHATGLPSYTAQMPRVLSCSTKVEVDRCLHDPVYDLRSENHFQSHDK